MMHRPLARNTVALAVAVACAAILPSTGVAAELADHVAATALTTASGRPAERAAPVGSTPARGVASFYAHFLSGRRTASGERYDPDAMTAAHRSLPMGTRLKVVNPKNDRSVVVTVNDRGPVPKNRMIDVSAAAAHELGMKASGVTRVETHVVGSRGTPGDDVGSPIAEASDRLGVPPAERH